MRVPLSWLSEFIELPETDRLVELLTTIGLKVESVERLGEGIEGVVVAQVLGIEPHPNADKLTLVDIDDGSEKRRVVCGAKNFAVDDLVPLARPGAKLPGGLEISRSKIRGELSDGMLCSAREMGLGDDHSGIYVLPPSPLGADVRSVLGLDDVVIELEVTPNRPDELSLIGIAREVAAATGGSVVVPEVTLEDVGPDAASLVKIEVADPLGCPVYLGRVVTDVSVGPSPVWVQRRLRAAGYRPVSNVVDATNYVLLVTGQPLHAFDLDKVGGSKIIVRRAGSGEKITTLDGDARELDVDDLVIADAERPMAIAGVMGGLETEVSVQTKRVILESAHFDPRSIARSAKRHGLRSEASARFERGSDPRNIEYPASLATSLMVDWAGGRASAGSVVVGSAPELGQPIALRPDRCRTILGFDISDEEMVDALTRLDLSPTLHDGVIRVERLSRRGDLVLEEDLIEEVARLGGYDRVPSTLPVGRYRAGSLTRAQILTRRIRSTLAGAGLFEAYTPTFIGPDDLTVLGIEANHAWGRPLSVTNPLSRDESLLRTSLIPGLLQSVKTNTSRRNIDVRLFEIGRVFHRSDGQLPNEPERLGIVVTGTQRQEWLSGERELDFFDLKGALEVLFSALRTPDVRFVDSEWPPAHPTRSALITTGGRTLGVAGELDPSLAEEADLGTRVFFAEIDLDVLIETATDPQPTAQVWKFPAVLLDLAIVIEDAIAIDRILEAVQGVGGGHLESARVFDVYRGAQVDSGYRSVAISLVFRSEERTMTESEAIEVRDQIAEEMSSRFGAQVRGS